MSSPPATESLTNSSSVSEPESADGSGSGSGAMYTPLLNPEDEHKVLPLPLKVSFLENISHQLVVSWHLIFKNHYQN